MNSKRPDFSDVRSGSSSAPVESGATPLAGARPDFSDVRSGSSSAPVSAGEERTYTVRSGDTLSAIAKQVYGRASRWQAIFDANRDQLDDPDRIRPGQVLRLPDAPAA